jgi:ADP-ribose pyrophosphatase
MKVIKLKKKFFAEKVKNVKLPNGEVVRIHVIEHNGSVVIIPLKNNKIILERQFRPVINKWAYELPAGSIEKGETAEECARRELVEETGYFPKKLKKIFSSYPSIGYSTELQHFFVATELKKVGRKPLLHEVIKLKEVSIEEAVDMIKKHKIIDGKTIQALLFFVLTSREK